MTKHQHYQLDESQEIEAPKPKSGFNISIPEWAGKPLFILLLAMFAGGSAWGTGVFTRLVGIDDNAEKAVESLDNSTALDAAVARASKRGLEDVAAQLAASNANAREWRDSFKSQQDTILLELREMQTDVAALKGDVQSLRRDRWRAASSENTLPNAVPPESATPRR